MINQYFDQVCNAFFDAICISDSAGIIVFVNDKHAELTGLLRKDMIGKSIETLVNEGLFDTALNPQIIREKNSATAIQNIANGRQLVLSGHPLFDEKGEVAYVITFIRDITLLTDLRKEIVRQKELLATFQRQDNQESIAPVIVCSNTMQEIYRELEAFADTDVTVLLLGETGVGKGVVAREIHNKSMRADKVFIKLDCGSIPENLIETELFGYVSGTFSGANKQGKVGLIEAAAGGTLFLDEIGELPLGVQTRLLRFLQDKEVLRVGSITPSKVNARVIAATNQNLQQSVKKGRFRADLYYRLNVAVIQIPALRKRRDDILPIAYAFLAFYNNKYHKQAKLLAEQESLLRNYLWPGNVRELENTIQRFAITGTISIDNSLSPSLKKSVDIGDSHKDLFSVDIANKSYKEIMQDFEATVLKAGIQRYGSLSKAAKHFGMDRSTMFRKLKNTEK